MDVSVIIINYNTFHLTCNCIRSILAMTTGCTFEIIVVDNASTECDPAEFLNKFPSVRLVSNKNNVGFAKGNNLGIEIAKGENILMINSDAELLNDAISICLRRLHESDRIAAVASRLTYPNGSVQHNCQRFPSIRGRLFELLRLQKLLPAGISGRILLGYFFDHNTPVYPDWVWGTFFLFKKKLLASLPSNKLADDFFMYAEDIQWCLEFRRLGYLIAFEPEARVLHHMGKSGGEKSLLIEKNSAYLLERYYPRWKTLLIRKLDILLS